MADPNRNAGGVSNIVEISGVQSMVKSNEFSTMIDQRDGTIIRDQVHLYQDEDSDTNIIPLEHVIFAKKNKKKYDSKNSVRLSESTVSGL